MSALMEEPGEAGTQPPPEGAEGADGAAAAPAAAPVTAKRVGWPSGKKRGPRPQQAATRPPDASSGEITKGWHKYRSDYFNKDGKAIEEARKAYHTAAFDVLMLLSAHITTDLPADFMKWVQQCQPGLLGKD